MRIIAFAAVAPFALAAQAATAQDSTGTVDISGSVAGRCLFTTDNASIPLGELALAGADTNAGKLNTAVVNGRTATLIGWCNNAASTMEVEATRLTNTASAASGFTNVVDYTARATANNVDAIDTTTVEGVGSAADVGMFTGEILVTLESSAATGLLVAGDYNGDVTVTLRPNFVAAP